MRFNKRQKIEYIKTKMIPLINDLDLNNKNREVYEWADGNLYYYIRKEYLNNEFYSSETDDRNPKGFYEIYISISNIFIYRRQFICETFVYDKNYEDNSLGNNFIYYKDYCFQVM